MIKKALNYIKTNQAVTLIDEVLAEFPELNPADLNQPDILKALENNKIKLKAALKIKLFKNNTTQSLLELDKILTQENNDNKSNDYINNLIERWFTGEQ